jgi:NitT/TauT family transport system substrate-binding protein
MTLSLPAISYAQTVKKPLTKLNVGNATVSTPPYASYNTSIPQAIFFAEEGLEVKMLGLGGATVAVQALETGQVDVALPANSAPLGLLEKLPNTDIVGFYTFINGFQSMPVVLKNSPIKNLGDLAGKTIGVQTLGNSQVRTTKALVQIAGGDANSLKFVAVGEGVEAAHALQSKRIDALVLFDGLYGQVEASGVPLRSLTSEATNQNAVGFSGSVITRGKFLKENRDILVRYGRAIAKSTVFAKENPEAAVRIHWKVYPETKQRGVSEEVALRNSLAALNARLANLYEVDGLMGNSSLTQIEGYISLMKAGGQLTNTAGVGRFWDPSLLKEINNFDKEAVRKRAREWKAN